MSYVKSNLLPSEKILYTARVHTAILIPAGLSFIFSMILLMSAIYYSLESELGILMGCGLFLLAGSYFLSSLVVGTKLIIAMFTTEFAVTNKRVIAKAGLIRRNTLEILLQKVESVSVNQSILGRMLNYGTIKVTGTGGSTQGFSAIAEPLTVRKRVYQVIEHYSVAQSKQN